MLLELQDSISRSINIHTDRHTHTHSHCTHSCDGLTFFLSVVTPTMIFFYPMRNAFYHVTQWWWWCCLRGRGGGSPSDSCFPSALSQLQSASRNLTGLEQPSAAQRCVGGQKYLQLKGHPNVFSHIHGAHQHLKPALVQRYVQIHNQKSKRVTAIWESLSLFLIVSRPFTPTQLC